MKGDFGGQKISRGDSLVGGCLVGKGGSAMGFLAFNERQHQDRNAGCSHDLSLNPTTALKVGHDNLQSAQTAYSHSSRPSCFLSSLLFVALAVLFLESGSHLLSATDRAPLASGDVFRDQQTATSSVLDTTATQSDPSPIEPEFKLWVKARELHNQASRRVDSGDPAGALELSNQSIAINPSEASFFGLRASIHSRLRQYQPAFADIDKAISLEPKNAGWYVNRAEIYLVIGQFDRAFEDYARATQVDPSHQIIYWNRGILNLHLKKYSDACKDFDTCLELQPLDARAAFYRAQAKERLGHFSEAIEDLKASITFAVKTHDLTYLYKATDELRRLLPEPPDRSGHPAYLHNLPPESTLTK